MAYGWISDALGGRRWPLLIPPAVSFIIFLISGLTDHQIFNFVGMIIVASYPDYGATFFGYLINAASWGYWPVLYAWISEICHKDAEERAIVIGVAQTFGQAFVAWVPGEWRSI